MAIKVDFSKNFQKDFKKLDNKIKSKFSLRLEVFISNQSNPILNNHALSGAFANNRSINITGDIRAIYKEVEEGAYFIAIGSHSKLYK